MILRTGMGPTVLLHDFLQLAVPEATPKSLLRSEGHAPTWPSLAETRWLKGEHIQGATRVTLNRSVPFAWPSPCCTTFFQWDWFAATWERLIDDLGPTMDVSYQEIALWWILCGTTVLDGVLPSHSGSSLAFEQTFGVSGRLTKFSLSSTSHEPLARAWLLGCLALLCPEFGVFRYAVHNALSPPLQDFVRAEEDALFAGHKRRVQLLEHASSELASSMKNEVSSPNSPFPTFGQRWANEAGRKP
jgi:hypothetical protein